MVAVRQRRLTVLLAVSCVLWGAATASAAAPSTRGVLLVGNNWDGTADVLDVPTFKRLDRIDVAPDREERLAQMMMDPAATAALLFVRTQIGEGHDQLVDDMFSSPDGRTMYVSRPSFGDVMAIDLATRRIVWRTPVEDTSLRRADHMAISPDGARLVVSGQTLAGPQDAEVIDAASGKIVGRFPCGDSPHENNFSRDGTLIYHASIGRVWTPTDEAALDVTKGKRVFEIVDAHTLKVLREIDMGQKLAEFGRPGMSSAVRPIALSRDERFVYFQVSFFHGFVEYDLEADKVTRVAELPIPPQTANLRRDEYILDSAHHGIAINGEGTKLCVAGTMSNYAAIVHRDDFSYRIHPLGARTYWSTTSADGKYCYVSVAGDDTLSVISYGTEEEVARVPVGDHPQRARTAKVATSIFGSPSSTRARARSLSLRASPRRDRRPPFRFRISGRLLLPSSMATSDGCHGVARVELEHGKATVGHRNPRLRAGASGCTYATTVRVAGRVARRARSGSVIVTAVARFAGNDAVLPQQSARRRLRVG